MTVTLRQLAEWHAERARQLRHGSARVTTSYDAEGRKVQALGRLDFHEEAAELLSRVSDLTEGVPT